VAYAGIQQCQIRQTDALAFTHLVNGYNYFGLCDMHGNVFEWCEDWYGETYYTNSPKVDPKGPDNGTEWVLRGGGWSNREDNCRAAYRSHDDGQLCMLFNGFRVVASLPGQRFPHEA